MPDHTPSDASCLGDSGREMCQNAAQDCSDEPKVERYQSMSTNCNRSDHVMKGGLCSSTRSNNG